MRTVWEDLSRAKRLERRWFWMCLAAWIILLPASAWISAQEGVTWDALASPVNALTGGFGAAVLAAVLFQKWRDRIDIQRRADERRAWLTHNFNYALTTTKAMSETLAQLVSEAYGTMAPVFREDRVPEEMLRRDIRRQPGPISETRDPMEVLGLWVPLLKGLTDTPGPLETAALQLAYLNSRLGSPYVDPEQATALTAKISPDVLPRITVLADRLFGLMPDVTGLRDVEPGQLREHGIELVMAGQQLSETVARSGTPLSRAEVLSGISRLLDAASAMRQSMWVIARDLATESEEMGGWPGIRILHQRFSALFDDRQFNEHDWEHWRIEHGFDTENAADEGTVGDGTT